MSVTELPIPSHYDSANVVNDTRWIDYLGLEASAESWRAQHNLKARKTDRTRVCLLVIDAQNTFCHPSGELFVAGQSGNGAVEDSQRTVEFIYRNLGILSEIQCTMDTHRAFHIFFRTYLVNDQGDHPPIMSMITLADIKAGTWKASPQLASALGVPNPIAAQAHLEHYAEELEKKGRYALTIWPYHAMLGDKGHNLVSGLAEACFFHAVARGAQTKFEIKGTNPWTENYSVLGPEVLTDSVGKPIAQRNTPFIELLLDFDALIIAGQAKSHCVAWTIDDLLGDITAQDPELAKKVYLLEDCTSPVVVPGIVDYTSEANAAFDKFKAAGMHVVQSTDPISSWPDIRL